jgi:small-conductance mechanosensitive channel
MIHGIAMGIRAYGFANRLLAKLSLDFSLCFCSSVKDFLTAETRLRFQINRLFREHEVVIPFPQGDVHMMAPASEKTV